MQTTSHPLSKITHSLSASREESALPKKVTVTNLRPNEKGSTIPVRTKESNLSHTESHESFETGPTTTTSGEKGREEKGRKRGTRRPSPSRADPTPTPGPAPAHGTSESPRLSGPCLGESQETHKRPYGTRESPCQDWSSPPLKVEGPSYARQKTAGALVYCGPFVTGPPLSRPARPGPFVTDRTSRPLVLLLDLYTHYILK